MSRSLDLHERVAARMALSESVGPYTSYEVILAALRRRFPTEDELLQYMKELEKKMAALGVTVPPGWSFLDD